MSAGSDDTSLPGSPTGSVLGKAVEAKLAELSAATTDARTARKSARDAKRAAKKQLAKDRAKVVAEASKQLARLTRQQELDEQTRIIDSIALRGLRAAEGLFLEPGEEGYNPDAIVPMPDANTRTHFGMKVYAQMMANKRDNNATARTLGVILSRARLDEADWNAEARRVDEEQRRAHAIDVAAEMVNEVDEP